MQKLLSLMMGLEDTASQVEMRKRYQRLVTALYAAESENPRHSSRYQAAREQISITYERHKKQLLRPEYAPVPGNGLLLGEILVDSQMITHDQLADALEKQTQSKLPLGRILVAAKLISWEQLAYYLRLQDLLQLQPTECARLSRQLTELGLASKAEMEMAEFDCETTGCTLIHAVERRGWLPPDLLNALTAGGESNTQDKTSPVLRDSSSVRALTA